MPFASDPSPPPLRNMHPMYPIKCADCGNPDTVPFRPDGQRPVYCRSCWREKRDQQKSEASARIKKLTRSGYHHDQEAGMDRVTQQRRA